MPLLGTENWVVAGMVPGSGILLLGEAYHLVMLIWWLDRLYTVIVYPSLLSCVVLCVDVRLVTVPWYTGTIWYQ
jgi:hypothetical protein